MSLESAPTSRTGRELGLLVVLTLALHLPFVGQAFHLDDVQYLDIARNVPHNPLFPLDLPYVFEGQQVTLWGHTHPPLNGYVLAALLWLGGDPPSEVFLHSVYLFFPLLVTVAFYFLARRFVAHPLLATALLACVPVLVVSAHTLMTDVPLLALWLCATALFVYGVDEGNPRLEVAALLPMTAAVFYAYQGLALFPLLAFYAFQRGRLGKRLLLLLTLPVLLLIAWQLAGYAYKGSFYAGTMLGYLDQMRVWKATTKLRTAISSLTYLGGALLLFPFLFLAFARLWRGLAALIALALGLLLALTRFAGYGSAQKTFFVLCFAGGLLTTLWIFHRLAVKALGQDKDRDSVFLSLWFLGVLFYCIVIFFSGSARYLLPAAPPLILLLVRATQDKLGVNLHWRVFYGALLACQLLLGLAAAHADSEFANAGRQAVRDFQQRHLSPGESFLFSGEWGFRYYLDELGGTIMTADSRAPAGTLVVKSQLCLSKNFDNELERSLQTIEKRTYSVSSPLRLLDYRARAGWWSDGWGVLPFWFSRQPLDEVTVYRVGESP